MSSQEKKQDKIADKMLATEIKQYLDDEFYKVELQQDQEEYESYESYEEDNDEEDEFVDNLIAQKTMQKLQIKKCYANYDLDQMDQLLNCMLDKNWQFCYTYQPGKSIGVNYTNFVALQHNNYVNDIIINFFLKIIEQELITDKMRSKVYIYNTYFCQKLLPKTSTNLSQLQPLDINSHFLTYQNKMAKWGQDIFQKEYLIFPIHYEEHWSVLIIVNPQDYCLEMLKSPNIDSGYCLYFDSLATVNLNLILLIKLYLIHKFRESYDMKIDDSETFQFALTSKTKFYQPVVPRQTNYVDCGMYLLEYVETFLQDTRFILQNIDKLKLSWFPRILVIMKRIMIKKLLVNMTKSSVKVAIQKYRDQRNDLQKAQGRGYKDYQYDKIDMQLFEQYLKIYNDSRHYRLLKFYLSPEFNHYDDY